MSAHGGNKPRSRERLALSCPTGRSGGSGPRAASFATRPVRQCGHRRHHRYHRAKRAEDALRHYATRLASLHNIDRAILAIQPPEKIARVALRHVAKLVPCSRASIAQIDPGSKEGRILTSIGALSRRTAHGTNGGLTVIEPEDLETLKRGQSIIVDDLHEQTSLSEQLKLLKDAGARSVVRLPLLVRGRLIGSINLYSDRPRAYTAENVELIGEAADQVAIALHNARLYKENRLARERLEVLSRRLIRARKTSGDRSLASFTTRLGRP